MRVHPPQYPPKEGKLRKFVIGALSAALVALAVSGIATAGTKDGVSWELGYSATKAKKSTGFSADIDSTGTADASGKPRAARKVTIKFAPGTKFNTRVKPTCDKDDLRSEGAAGCPRASRVGDGTAEAVTGLAALDPVRLTVEAFNARNAILFYVRSASEPPVTLILEGKLRGNRLTVPVPAQPIPFVPFREAILTKFSVDVDAARKGRGRKARYYATTPRSCPKGRWTTTAVFQYDDGRTTVRDSDTCRRTRRR